MGHNLSSIGSRLKFRSFRYVLYLSTWSCCGYKRVSGCYTMELIALNVHVKFGPLKLYAAYTPALGKSYFTYGFTCTDQAQLPWVTLTMILKNLPLMWLLPNDESSMIALQDRKADEKFCIQSSPTPTKIANIKSQLLQWQ